MAIIVKIRKGNNSQHPYTIGIDYKDIIFKEMDYKSYNGLECFQFYVDNHHIGTLYDDDTNRKYMQGLINGKVNAVVSPQPNEGLRIQAVSR